LEAAYKWKKQKTDDTDDDWSEHQRLPVMNACLTHSWRWAPSFQNQM
jgi:hypothetical protein